MEPSESPARCPLADHVVGYVNCTLDEFQADAFDSHLSNCQACSRKLAQVIESGMGPTWLADLRLVRTTTDHRHDQTLDYTARDALSQLSSADEIKLTASDERYQLVRLHGEGGMGRVWEGWDTVMQRRVALKQLRSGHAKDELNRRLVQEASSLARLSHPNIVAIFEVLILKQQPTLVMEFIDGPNLGRQRKDVVMGERQAARIVERLAEAISLAHKQGVIHRDLKPGNVLLQWPADRAEPSTELDRAIPKLTDFGLAKLLEGEDLTRTGELLGTPAYMAPEQTIGHGSLIGPAVDIYGLGAILYELLTGTPPHVAEDPFSTMLLVREREPVAPRTLRPELSKDIETICLKCLRKLPKDRYATAANLQDDLQALLQGRPITARPLSPAGNAIRWARRHKPLVASGLIALGSLIALIVGSLWTAASERELRLQADQAKNDAKTAGEKASFEADRANRALATSQQHFDVALQQVNQLAYLVFGPQIYQEQFDAQAIRHRIVEATMRIYDNYLNSLAAPEQWTFHETFNVTLFIETALKLDLAGQVVEPWQRKLDVAMVRFEADKENPLRNELVMRYHNALSRAAERDGEHLKAATHWEKSAGALADAMAQQPDDPHIQRFYSHNLIYAAIQYSTAGQYEKAIPLANQSVDAYRQVLKTTNGEQEDQANFLDKLYYHATLAKTAGDQKEAVKNQREFEAMAAMFRSESPLYDRIQGIQKRYRELLEPVAQPKN